MRKCNDLTCVQIENMIVEWLRENPKSSIEEISSALGLNYSMVRKVIEGKPGSRASIGLLENGYVRALPGINYKNNRLVWLYQIVN